MLNAILGAVPNIFAAALVLAISFVVGRLVAGLVERLLSGVGFDRVLEWLGIRSGQQASVWPPSRIIATLVVCGRDAVCRYRGLAPSWIRGTRDTDFALHGLSALRSYSGL